MIYIYIYIYIKNKDLCLQKIVFKIGTKKIVTRTKRYAVYVPPNTVMVVPPLGV